MEYDNKHHTMHFVSYNVRVLRCECHRPKDVFYRQRGSNQFCLEQKCADDDGRNSEGHHRFHLRFSFKQTGFVIFVLNIRFHNRFADVLSSFLFFLVINCFVLFNDSFIECKAIHFRLNTNKLHHGIILIFPNTFLFPLLWRKCVFG